MLFWSIWTCVPVISDCKLSSNPKIKTKTKIVKDKCKDKARKGEEKWKQKQILTSLRSYPVSSFQQVWSSYSMCYRTNIKAEIESRFWIESRYFEGSFFQVPTNFFSVSHGKSFLLNSQFEILEKDKTKPTLFIM